MSPPAGGREEGGWTGSGRAAALWGARQCGTERADDDGTRQLGVTRECGEAGHTAMVAFLLGQRPAPAWPGGRARRKVARTGAGYGATLWSAAHVDNLGVLNVFLILNESGLQGEVLGAVG